MVCVVLTLTSLSQLGVHFQCAVHFDKMTENLLYTCTCTHTKTSSGSYRPTCEFLLIGLCIIFHRLHLKLLVARLVLMFYINWVSTCICRQITGNFVAPTWPIHTLPSACKTMYLSTCPLVYMYMYIYIHVHVCMLCVYA